jgi:hypothetical protein
MSQNDLAARIEQLSQPEVAETLKNLCIALQYQQERQVSEADARRDLGAAALAGGAGTLREAILVDKNARPEDIERWGKSLLHCLGADPDLQSLVAEAIDDAQSSNSKDFGLGTLIVLGVIVVALKYRPHKVTIDKGHTTIEWKENDISVVRSLISGVTGVTTDG